MKNNHVNQQLPDYVLNLLPKMERQAVEQHTAVCGNCQQALRAEREMGQMVRLTLQTATHPANGRLTQLMPTIPQHRKLSSSMVMGWQRPLALVGLLVVILFGSFGAWNGRSHNIWGVPSPTSLATTATSTRDVTATLAQQTSEAKETSMARQLATTAVASPTVRNTAVQTTAQAYIAATPPPPPTPIAAIPAAIATN
jgi:anti-sigma factor RsiW